MFEIEQFRAWVEKQPEVVGISRASVINWLAFVDESPVAQWASELLGRKVSLMGGSVRAVPSQVSLRGVKLPRWMYELDRWCNRKRATPILKGALLERVDAMRSASPTQPSWPALFRRRP